MVEEGKVAETEQQSLEPTTPEVDERELEAAAALFIALSKTARIVRLYPSDNAIYARFADSLHRSFEQFLAEHRELAVRVEPDRLSYRGNTMLAEPGRRDSIPRRLHQDGIRQIAFHEGITREELLDFLAVIVDPPAPDDLEDDVVTLLWQKNFSHLHYFVQDSGDGDRTLDLARDVRLGHEAENLLQLAELHGLEDDPALVPGGADQAEGSEGGPPRGRDDQQMLSPASMAAVMTLGEHDREALREMVERDLERDVRRDLTGLLFEVMHLQAEDEAVENTVGVLALLQRSFLEAGEIAEASDVLRRLRELQTGSTRAGLREVVERRISEVTGPETLELLVGLVESPRVDNPRRLIAFLELLLGDARPWLLENLHRVRDRRFVERILTVIGRDQIEQILSRMSDQDPATVRRLVRMVAASGDRTLVEKLLPNLDHEDQAVRMETVRALARLGGPDARTGLDRAARSKMPQLRIVAFRAMGELADPELAPGLMERTRERSFRHARPEEQQEILNAIARCAPDAALGFLGGLLARKSRFRPRRAEALRIRAATALGFISTTASRELLSGHLQSARGDLLSAVLMSLRRMQGGRGEANEEGDPRDASGEDAP